MRKHIPLLFLSAAILFLLRAAYSPQIYLRVESGADHKYWHDFWSSRPQQAELRIPEENIPAVIPGPLDAWGGNKPGRIELRFELPPGEYTLRLSSFDAHEAAPPILSFSLNGDNIGKERLTAGRGLPPPYEKENHKLTLRMPLSAAQTDNILVISTTEGSWFAPAGLQIKGGKRLSLSGLDIAGKPLTFGLIAALFLLFPLLNSLNSGKKTRTKIIIALFAGLSLYTIFSSHRENLMPVNADYKRSLVLFGGDEPAYIMTGQAIARGDWLDVKRTHQEKLYLLYWDRPMTSFPSFSWQWYMGRGVNPLLDRSSWWEDKQILSRPPLLPLMISPLGLFSGNPRWKSAFFLTIFASLSAALIFYLTADKKRPYVQGLQALVLILCMGAIPIAYYTTVIFPEIIGGCLLLAALALIGDGKKPAGIVLLFISLWSTQRIFAGVALATAFIFYAALKKRDRRLIALIAAGWGAYFFYHFFVWGLPMIPNIHPASKMDFSLLPLGAARFFMSREVGLFFLSPVSLIGLAAGAYLIVKERCDIDIIWGLTLAGLILPIACFPDYRAGSCPAGRFQVIAACVMIFPLLRLFPLQKRKSRPLPTLFLPAAVFGAAGFAIGGFLISRPNFWFRQYHPLFGFERLRPYYNLLPEINSPGWALKAALWLASFFLLAAILELTANIYNRKAEKRFDRKTKLCLNDRS